MEVRTDPVVLWARALLLAVVGVFLGVAGHVTADGLLPGPLVLGVLLVVSVVACASLLARPASTLKIVVLLVGGQAAVHLVLTVSGGHVGDPTTATHRAPTGLGAALPTVDGRRVGSLQESYETSLGTGSLQPSVPVGHLVSDLSDHAPMMAAHLLAAALVGLWLAVGERCLWTLLALASTLVLRPLLLAWALVRTGVEPVRAFVRTHAEPAGLRATDLLARCVVRRGPPLFAA